MHRFVPLFVCAALLSAQEAEQNAFYSAEKEFAIGAQFAAEIRRNAEYPDSPEVVAWVRQLGARLVAATAGKSPARWTFDLVATDHHEPYAFPGGFVLLPARLFIKAQDEAEFAGVLAHSMAHLIARHGLNEAAQAPAGSNATAPLIYMGGWTGPAGRTPWPASLAAAARNFELEADKLGAEIMALAGYDPSALRNFISREDGEPDAALRAERLAALQVLTPIIRPQPPTGHYPSIQEAVRSKAFVTSPRKAPTLHKQ